MGTVIVNLTKQDLEEAVLLKHPDKFNSISFIDARFVMPGGNEKDQYIQVKVESDKHAKTVENEDHLIIN